MDLHLSPQACTDHLKRSGLKPTSQRVAVLMELASVPNHPTAEDLHARLRHTHPSLSLGTVYRTLETLAKAGMVHKVMNADGLLRYDAETHTHHHLVDTATGTIHDYHDPELNELLREYFARRQPANFQVSDFQVQLFGRGPQPNPTPQS